MLDNCLEKLDLPSDYALAKVFEVKPARVYGYRKGTEHPDTFVCFKIAEILELSPSKVIAYVEANNAKNPRKALFFQHFLTAVGLWIILAVIPVNYGILSNNVQAAGDRANTDINAHYTKRFIIYCYGILADLCRYFTCNWTRKALRA